MISSFWKTKREKEEKTHSLSHEHLREGMKRACEEDEITKIRKGYRTIREATKTEFPIVPTTLQAEIFKLC